MNYMFFEGDIEKRIEKAKKRAESLLSASPEDPSDFIYSLRIILCREYKIPLFDKYFEDRTIDELVFEIELLRGLTKNNVEKGSDLLKNDSAEASALFDDFVEQDSEQIGGVDDSFMEEAKKFMETGNFIEDKQSGNP